MLPDDILTRMLGHHLRLSVRDGPQMAQQNAKHRVLVDGNKSSASYLRELQRYRASPTAHATLGFASQIYNARWCRLGNCVADDQRLSQRRG